MIKSAENSKNIVFSTDHEFDLTGIIVPNSPLTDSNQTIYLHLERKGGGKTVTLIKGYSKIKSKLNALAKDIKKLIGAGGSVKNEYIIIQGNNRDKILNYLEGLGHKVKKSGG